MLLDEPSPEWRHRQYLMEIKNSERFLIAYTKIENEIKKMLDLKEHRRFYDLVHMASKIDPVIRRYKFDLREYSDLRNVLIHDRADGRVLAEPTDEVVIALEEIVSMLLDPPRVMPLFKRKVLALDIFHSASRAIREMSRTTYSQVAVIENHVVVTMLTSHMIVSWLGKSLADRTLDLDNASIHDILDFTGIEDNFVVIPENASLFEALDHFYRYQMEKKKLEAALITRNGLAGETLLGIITNRNLPLLQRKLEQARRGIVDNRK
ncbi:MAG: CBS domain-containing protein [Firmicutes bacterium]|nr:CBS domain-containing protein [Bacillota bacterium]